ncbi:MAG: glucose-1-phosphate adenylyltransferase [Deltaproteobacteria bacterium]|nr:glucose-1-phosphate adenylyltransferase [Deltaproteobacteria bacterium]
MRKTVAMIFAGGRVEELSVLTFHRPKAAIVFGGSYRMIDFALTNLANCELIETVGILSQYKPSSLIDHVGIGLPWDFVGTHRAVRFLPPYTGPEASHWYRGTADALFQNLDFLELHRPDDVLIVSGDHAYQMDYMPLLRFHVERGAELTMGFTPIDLNPSRFGIAELDAEGRVMAYAEKPEKPRSNLASMTVYAFRCNVLMEELKRASEAAQGKQSFYMYDEVIPRIVARRKAYGWVHYGGWEYARTLDGYYRVHQDMLGDVPKFDIAAMNVRTNTMSPRAAPPTPARHMPTAHVSDSIVSTGCRIEGTVEHSVLSPHVHIGKGAIVRNSILWDGVVIEEGAVVDRVIADKRVVVGKGARVGWGNEAPSEELPKSLTCGAAVLGADAHVPAGAQIGRNCILYPGVGPDQLSAGPVESGRTVRAPTR